MGAWKTGRGQGRDSFIAKTLLKTLRKLPPLQVSDFVRRIPLPLQALRYRNTRPVAATNPCMIQQMRQLALYYALTEVIFSLNT
jgi:hypothetical protein